MKIALHRRSRRHVLDSRGRGKWVLSEDTLEVSPEALALIVCDMWDRHWCRSAAERVQEMAPRVNRVLAAARGRGALIIHAPSETIQYYEGSPARLRATHAPPAALPAEVPHDDPILPIDDSNGGCDSTNNPGAVNERLWTRQHPAIVVDQDRDVISDEGAEIYRVLQGRGIQCVVIAGVHTNMCILNRTFGIRQLVRWGVKVLLCRDLTDSMYDPESPPYVDHDKGTDLVIGYIESYWCPSIHSDDLTA